MSDIARPVLTGLLMLMLPSAVVAAEALGDPTRPSYVTEKAPRKAARAPSWQVDSIIVSPGRRLAVVNGRTVAVNDRVNGARILEILPYEVRLEYKGAIHNITLIPNRVKSPAT
ncbi:MAG: hypothetical protein KY410_01975 [Proteobacteria bacterium]|nr:hypothetical protein [Pseudomonadota bacterium]